MKTSRILQQFYAHQNISSSIKNPVGSYTLNKRATQTTTSISVSFEKKTLEIQKFVIFWLIYQYMLTIKSTQISISIPDFVGFNLSHASILLTLDSKFYSMNNDKKILNMAPQQCLVLLDKLRLQSYNLMWTP